MYPVFFFSSSVVIASALLEMYPILIGPEDTDMCSTKLMIEIVKVCMIHMNLAPKNTEV